MRATEDVRHILLQQNKYNDAPIPLWGVHPVLYQEELSIRNLSAVFALDD